MTAKKITFFFISILLLLLVIFSWQYFHRNKETGADVLPPEESKVFIPKETGLDVLSPKPGEKLASPIKINGSIHGDGWSAFEAQAGTVELIDANGKSLGRTMLKTNGEWMQLPVDFSAALSISPELSGPATLIFRNENPSGIRENDRSYRLPIILLGE